MVRNKIFQKESCGCGGCVAAAGMFQPGDGTRYVFQAAMTDEPGMYICGGLFMKGIELHDRLIADCYGRHPSAVGHWDESESYRACSDPFVDEIAKMTGALNPTIWAFVQWFCEVMLS